MAFAANGGHLEPHAQALQQLVRVLTNKQKYGNIFLRTFRSRATLPLIITP